MMKKKWQMPQEFRFYCRFQESQVFFAYAHMKGENPLHLMGAS